MKKISLMFLCSLALVEGRGQSVIPVLTNSGFSLKSYGAFQGVWVDTAWPETSWRSLRLYLDARTPSPVSFFGELELRDALLEDRNWVRRAEVVYKLNENWKVRGGRLFLASSFITPAPMNLETVQYPHLPFGQYATGLELEARFGDWRLKANVAGKSGELYNSPRNWESVEFTTRLERKLSAGVTLAGSMQLGEGFERFALDYAWRQDRVCLKGAVYSAFENERDIFGGYTFAGYRLLKHAELHTQMDYSHDSSLGERAIWTNGIRVWAINDQASLTLDHEFVLTDRSASRFFARLQFKF